ncbi:hypothetical protein MMYC01_204275 [Madurella mycetomatis]|uniref:Uncharacterized protein n=1 Tax=Madurella mycetomatis TaxID=100816 RepID=A0A175W404_9PEZI|nr:hypothetical protein MMYC01_204275 [Madurella mycetomatis]
MKVPRASLRALYAKPARNAGSQQFLSRSASRTQQSVSGQQSTSHPAEIEVLRAQIRSDLAIHVEEVDYKLRDFTRDVDHKLSDFMKDMDHRLSDFTKDMDHKLSDFTKDVILMIQDSATKTQQKCLWQLAFTIGY